MELYLTLKQCGPMILAVAFLLYDGWAREARIARQITRLEKEYRQRGLDGCRYNREGGPRRGGTPGPTVEIRDLGDL